MSKESSEMESSAAQNPGIIQLIEAGEFSTNSGMTGKKVGIAIKAREPGSSLIFYSIYLPCSDETSVTFKLKCNKSQFETLKEEFEGIVSNATKVIKDANQ